MTAARWDCPLCDRSMSILAAKDHRRDHIPRVTMDKYRKTFPKTSEELLCGMAFLHLLTHQHAGGHCCHAV